MTNLTTIIRWTLIAPVVLFASQLVYGERISGLELLQKQHADAHAAFAEKLNQWADFCETNSFVTDAERLRQKASDPALGLLDFDDLPSRRLPNIPANLQGPQGEWRKAVRKIEQDYAVELYQLARRAIEQKHASLAFQLIRELVYHDPDHEFGRKLLGYVLDGDEWTTRFEKTRMRDQVDHPQFGWLPKSYVENYENNLRFFNGSWKPVQVEREFRKDFRKGWEIETEHFRIKTNHSLERGVEISRELEVFHRYFLREFASFFDTPVSMQALFRTGSSRNALSQQYQINYYANRDDFVVAMNQQKQQIPIATGFYIPSQRTSYFYHDDSADEAETAMGTMFHEVTHQILGESNRRYIEVGQFRDFWVIEGIACYMESFKVSKTGQLMQNGRPKLKFEIGNPSHARIYWARQVALVDEAHVPMEQFFELSKDQFYSVNHDKLHSFYSQATGIVHFFLHYQDGLYRDAFIEYLSQVYSPSDRIRLQHETLSQTLGVPFPILDQQYIDYLKSLPPN